MRPTFLIFGLVIILTCAPSLNCQTFHPTYFRKFLLHATWANIQKLSQNLNKDKTLAQQITRLKNWTSKNFGTVKVKSNTFYDNRTYALERLTEFVTMRSYLRPLINTFVKNQLTTEIGSSDAQKVVNAYWRLDHYEMGINPRNAMSQIENGAHSFVAEKYKDKIRDILYVIQNKALENNDKWKYSDAFYFNLNTLEYIADMNTKKGFNFEFPG
ncbi:unnamed protein product [Auanema sp. JU1783]|nr:unnamed protein product [Auanema sp. JU1783]